MNSAPPQYQRNGEMNKGSHGIVDGTNRDEVTVFPLSEANGQSKSSREKAGAGSPIIG